ncbi:FecR family protein [Agriterribacter sp.]|uniref:FecR family protein n=1 Tax=Agriterribacter sp. TaxID=2821509 RepID=UPI002BA9A840|nr:FecR family protein [Agriterribacter sp.]HRO48000.1 FecR family protein [Agriterribacter sp.]HRQ16229.1 FecR family protein [Agriterribacter sp.]
MTVDSIWYILGKKLAGEASPEELEELEQMLRHHPNLHYPIQNITDLWRLKKPIDRTEALASLQKHLLRLGETEVPIQLVAEDACSGNTESRVIKKRSRYFMQVAAFSTLALLLSYAVYYFSQAGTAGREEMAGQEKHAAEKSEIATRPGAHSKIILPDGSTVLLNAGSKLTYNKHFDAAIREVELTGEAYFDVKKDVQRPFIIHAQEMNIKVLGTAFNVKSYPGDKSSETSLIHGSIEVTMNSRPYEKIILHPSEKLVVMNDAYTGKEAVGKKNRVPSSVVISKINYAPADSAVIETSWIDNRLIFRNKIFTELAAELERKYGMTFRFDDENTKQLMFDVNFKNETIQEVLQALQLANPFNYSIEKETIVITK